MIYSKFFPRSFPPEGFQGNVADAHTSILSKQKYITASMTLLDFTNTDDFCWVKKLHFHQNAK